MTIRHHIEFQSTDNRYGEIQRTADYEEFITRYEFSEDAPDLDTWSHQMVELYTNASGGPSKIRLWLVTRQELSAEPLHSGLAQTTMDTGRGTDG